MAVLDRFEEVGLIDDVEFARMWVDSRHRSKGLARSVLRQELRRKGVDDAVINAALEQLSDEGERERASQIVQRKLPALARYDTATQARRIGSLLVRRGYSQSVAVSVTREVLASVTDED